MVGEWCNQRSLCVYWRLTTVILAVLTAGCATYRTGRWVTIETHRVEAVSSESGDLSDALAVDLFRNVADKLGFAVKDQSKTHVPLRRLSTQPRLLVPVR